VAGLDPASPTWSLVQTSDPAEKWIIIHSYSSMWIIIHSYCSMLIREKKGLTWRRSRMHWCVVGPLFVSLSFLSFPFLFSARVLLHCLLLLLLRFIFVPLCFLCSGRRWWWWRREMLLIKWKLPPLVSFLVLLLFSSFLPVFSFFHPPILYVFLSSCLLLVLLAVCAQYLWVILQSWRSLPGSRTKTMACFGLLSSPFRWLFL